MCIDHFTLPISYDRHYFKRSSEVQFGSIFHVWHSGWGRPSTSLRRPFILVSNNSQIYNTGTCNRTHPTWILNTLPVVIEHVSQASMIYVWLRVSCYWKSRISQHDLCFERVSNFETQLSLYSESAQKIDMHV